MAAKRDAYALPLDGDLWTISIIYGPKCTMGDHSEGRAHLSPKRKTCIYV